MEAKIKKITDWIYEQGYPLEMYCENILSLNNYSVMQSLHYEDKETNKFREIDILATKFKVYNDVTFNFSIVIECKLSKEKPWLLFTRKQNNNYKDEIINDLFTTINGKLLINKSDELKKLSLLTYENEKIGFNMTQCFTTGKDIPYHALMSTTSACEYLVKKSNESKRKFCNFYFPVIVIDSELYECSASQVGELKIDTVEMGQLLSIRSYSERSSILHTIVTKKGFEQFAENLAKELDDLIEKMTFGFQYVADNRPSNPSKDFSFI